MTVRQSERGDTQDIIPTLFSEAAKEGGKGTVINKI